MIAIPDKLRTLLHGAKETLGETLWPTRCALCDTYGTLLCRTCMDSLPFIDSTKACKRCGAPFGRIQCTECSPITLTSHKRSSFPLDSMAHCVTIDEETKALVTIFKDQDEMRLASVIAFLMARYLDPSWIEKGTAITYIPASQEALHRRGFDHCALIASELCSLTSLPLMRTLEHPLRKDQRLLSRKGRVDNQANAYIARTDIAMPDSVVIIDDICTTGATMYNASDALKAAGVQKTFGLTFGRVMD